MKKIIKIAGLISLIFVSIVLIVNFIVVLSTKGQLKNDSSKKTDCILVLGAGVKLDGTSSKMLKDRLDKGIELYKKGVASKILLSGDNGTVEYNEVKAIRTLSACEKNNAEERRQDGDRHPSRSNHR